MPAERPLLIGVVGEDRVHLMLAKGLTDAVLGERLRGGGVDPDGLRAWIRWGIDGGGRANELLDQGALKRLRASGDLTIDRRPIRLQGRFDGSSAGRRLREDALWSISDAACAGEGGRRPDLVLMMWDTDGKASRRLSASEISEVAGALRGRHVILVVGVCEPEGEAWLLAGWRPGTAHERHRHELARRAVGADPCARPDTLRSKGQHTAKRMLRFLALGEGGRPESASDQAFPVDELAEVVEACLHGLVTLVGVDEASGAGGFLRSLRARLL